MEEKLDMQSPDWANKNSQFIAERFPNCVTETAEGIKVDFELLKQELSNDIIEGNKERYRLEWPGKREAIVTANLPTTKTLRPLREDSVDFDKTENLYIEGDNLEVLKLLQESYLGKIKMIYIDPPYNTGKDFVYKDNFSKDAQEELVESGQKDEYKQRLVVNPETAGRYHSDWLSMMYPRLKLARNLLTDDGVIFISIDDHEVANMIKIGLEIFGENNFVGETIRKTKTMTADKSIGFNLQHENLIIFSKDINELRLNGEKKDFENYNNPDNDIHGEWCSGDPSAKSGSDSTYFGITNPYTNKIDYPPKGRFWAFSQESLNDYIKKGKVLFKKEHNENERSFIFKRYKNELKSIYNPVNSLFSTSNDYMNQVGTKELISILGKNYFDNPKPKIFINKLIQFSTKDDDIILDFFSGSATTAHALMQLNAEDSGNLKFIMAQLPEATDEKSEAFKEGYKNICDIGKERIRRSAKKIKEETGADIDYGFRVYQLDSSNMQDVYYKPQEYDQGQLDLVADNVKSDRTADDLLAQVMLDWGLPLSLKIEQVTICNKKVFKVAGNSLYACFDSDIDEVFIKEIAKEEPMRIVF